MKKSEDNHEMAHNFAHTRRGAILATSGKTRVTMFLDNDVIDFFRKLATANGRGYQTEINESLRKFAFPKKATAATPATTSKHVKMYVMHEVIASPTAAFFRAGDRSSSRSLAKHPKRGFSRIQYRGAGRE